MMHGRGKSDEAIVAVKPANKAERSAAELVERRAEAKGNARHQSMLRTLCRVQHVTRDGRMRIIVYLMMRSDRTSSKSRPVNNWNSSLARWPGVPMPADAMLVMPGLALA